MHGAVVCKTCVTSGRVNPGVTPWDQRDEIGMLSAAWQSIKGLSFAPVQFFEAMAPAGKVGSAIGLLALITIPCSIMNTITGFATNKVIAPLAEPFIRQVYGPPGNTLSDTVVQSLEPNILMSAIGLFAYPFIMVVYALVTGLVCHLGLMLCGGAREGLEATVKTSVYAYVVTFWVVVPLAGSLSWIWMLVVLGMGLTTVHGSGGFKAAFAVLYAPCACCCLVFAGSFGLGFLGAFLAGSGGSF